jgi:lipid-A-disaccharide synthase
MSKTKLKIFIVAGEASGDNIGAKLISALKAKADNLEFYGIGGTKMLKAGLHSIFPMEELSIMGFAEVIPKIPTILQRLGQALDTITDIQPDIIITIDSFGFNSRLIKKVRASLGSKVKIYHYVSPTVWAYKPERAKIIRELYDHIFVILPFEKQYYDAISFSATFVGHPFTEDYKQISLQQKQRIRKDLGIDNDTLICAVMPGSRLGEITRHSSIFFNALMEVKKQANRQIMFYIPTFNHLKTNIAEEFPLSELLITDNQELKKQLFRITDLALVKSGTSSVEMMLNNIPHIVAYKIYWLSYWYLKAQILVKHISLVNIINDKLIVPEFIQGNCRATLISNELLKLVNNEKTRQKQQSAFQATLKLLGLGAKQTPSEKVADVILKKLRSGF